MVRPGNRPRIARTICRWGPLAFALSAGGALLLGASVPAVALGAFLGLCGLLCLVLFALSRSSEAAIASAVNSHGIQERRIVVDHGYQPATVSVEALRPVRLLFDRREAGECSAWVIVPALGLAYQLAPQATTAVEFLPEQPGVFLFSCKYGVCRGVLRVRVPDPARLAAAATGRGS